MEDAKLVGKVKKLLKTRKQITGRLVDGTGRCCIMGAVGLALGYKEVEKCLIDENGRTYSHVLESVVFPFNYEVSITLILEHQEKLCLSSNQIKLMGRGNERRTSYAWASLNDNFEFSFSQLNILIDLLMDNKEGRIL